VLALVREMNAVQADAAALVQQLMAFARKQALRPAALDLNDAIRDVERVLKSAVGQRAALRLELAGAPCVARVDPGQLRQVVMNLVLNARDAVAPGGTIRVVTSAAPALEPGPDRVALDVIDDGGGIPPEVMPHLFEPFFTTKGPGAGTGLGLPTVFGIVTQSGGEVRVTSEVGRGSTFRVLLPRVGPSQAPEVPAG
jgi:two-component system cell cycle sensor histidine kinase/response regulator CckA